MQQGRGDGERPQFSFPDADNDHHGTRHVQEDDEGEEGEEEGSMLGYAVATRSGEFYLTISPRPPRVRQRIDSVSPSLPQLPLNSGDLDFDVSTIINVVSAEESAGHSNEE